MWQGGPPKPRLQAPGENHYRGNHEYGVVSLQKGLSVHPEVAFGALRTEEVTDTAATAFFLLVSALGASLLREPPRSSTLDVAEWASCPNN